MEIISIQT